MAVTPLGPADKEHIDWTTFEQILSMDDEGDNSFSEGIVRGFLDQAETTITEMNAAQEANDFSKLSSLGHFLKGSSASIGLIRVRDICEEIQNIGSQDSPAEIGDMIQRLQTEYKTINPRMLAFYGPTTTATSA